MTKDGSSGIKVLPAFDIRTISTDTTTNGDIIDTQGFESCTFVFQTGTVTDGDYAVLIHEGDVSNLSDAAAVADADLIGTEALASFAADTDDNDVAKVGYKGTKRYVRLSVVSTSTSSGALVGGTCILSHPRSAPYSTQIVTD